MWFFNIFGGGGPDKVHGLFNCESCKNLIYLEGSPKHMSSFNCSDCPKLVYLKSFEGVSTNCEFIMCDPGLKSAAVC